VGQGESSKAFFDNIELLIRKKGEHT